MQQPSPIDTSRKMSRRDALKMGFQSGLSGLGLLWAGQWLAGCVNPTAGAAATGIATAIAGNATTWAAGGTALMKASYPDPFTTYGAGQTCTLTPELTVGPCYAETLMRKDVSEGLTGLPMRLSLRVVRADTCEPVEGATVDIWHTNAAGIYSAYPKGTMCNPDSEDAAKAHFFRGVQTTDANGRVDFHTVFPGWYSSRTVHVHFTVRVGDEAYVTSQLVFDDALTDAIYAEHRDYNSRPKRGTTNQNDTVVSASTAATFTVATTRLSDGVLQAWKAIAIRA